MDINCFSIFETGAADKKSDLIPIDGWKTTNGVNEVCTPVICIPPAKFGPANTCWCCYSKQICAHSAKDCDRVCNS